MSEIQTDTIMDMVSAHFKVIEGRVKTIVEASVPGDRQAEAAKSLIGPSIWSQWDKIKVAVKEILELKVAE